tara:strand:+ start:5619 stop:5900 length:282 start_codon:yes stop_codon:yes gene_type:complete
MKLKAINKEQLERLEKEKKEREELKKQKTKEKKEFKQKKCFHRRTEIRKNYKKNYPFGKKSSPYYYEPPIQEKEVCKNCDKTIDKWNPRRSIK